MTVLATGLRVRRVAEQGAGRGDGWTSRRVLSFGDDYDPAWRGVGPLVALNVERLEAGAGFAPHDHVGVEIVTVVLSGTLEHEVAGGSVLLAAAGSAVVVDATAGLRHTERAKGGTPAVLVTSWLAPPADVAAPDDVPDGGGSARVVGLRPEGLSSPLLRCPGARLRRTRVGPGGLVPGPTGLRPGALLVLGGSVYATEPALREGDALVAEEGAAWPHLRAGDSGTDLLRWDLPAGG